MTSEETKLDALLTTVTGRLLSAAASCSEMRAAILTKDAETAGRACLNVAEHMGIVDAVLDDISRIVESRTVAQRAITQLAARQQGGLTH
jgi:tetrahydromethanopterin S-methyltransferase subunit H